MGGLCSAGGAGTGVQPAARPARRPPRAQAAGAAAAQSASAAMAGAPTLALLLLGQLLAATVTEAQVSAGRRAAARVGVRGLRDGASSSTAGGPTCPLPGHPGPVSEPGTRDAWGPPAQPRGPSPTSPWSTETGRPTEPSWMARPFVDEPRSRPVLAWPGRLLQPPDGHIVAFVPRGSLRCSPSWRIQAADAASPRLWGISEAGLGGGAGARPPVPFPTQEQGTLCWADPRERVGGVNCMMTLLRFRKWDPKAPRAPKGHLGNRARTALM